MQELRVVGVEDGALIVVSDVGEHYRIAVDDSLQSHVRRATPESASSNKVTPREIQAHIRAGMSAQDVAHVTGAALEYIQRFEGPVLAEREYVVEAALAVAVLTPDDDEEGEHTFGAVIRRRLAELGAIGERWASWKERESGWVVKLAFSIDRADHDARWQFDPKTGALAPLNSEAESLSQQEDIGRPLLPRLRAVAPTEEHSRFDSGAFVPEDLPAPPASSTARARSTATSSAPEPDRSGHTADLLEALRRRRGERESAPLDDMEEAKAAHPASGSIRIVDVPIEQFPADEQATNPVSPLPKSSKRGRAAMPTWDEIVFGARPDDDLA